MEQLRELIESGVVLARRVPLTGFQEDEGRTRLEEVENSNDLLKSLLDAPIEFWVVDFDLDTFGFYRTEEAAKEGRDNRDNGAWEDCNIRRIVIK